MSYISLNQLIIGLLGLIVELMLGTDCANMSAALQKLL